MICFAYEFSFKKMVIVHVSNKHIKYWVFSMSQNDLLKLVDYAISSHDELDDGATDETRNKHRKPKSIN